jgi:regulator of replication initiation timing
MAEVRGMWDPQSILSRMRKTIEKQSRQIERVEEENRKLKIEVEQLRTELNEGDVECQMTNDSGSAISST